MDDRDFAARVRNLKASRHLYRVDVIARVESEDDIPFWQKVIQRVRPMVKVKFIPAEVSAENVRQRGKTLCLKLVDYLDEHFIICVDSDFDKFLRPGLLDPSKHILQTHAYSWENHHCHAEHLQMKWNEVGNLQFDFVLFLKSFSQVLYPILIGLLTAKELGIKSWSLDSLCGEILNVQVNQKERMADNAQLLLVILANKMEQWQERQQPLGKGSYSKMKQRASGVGMTADNAYLYMQGHCVYDLIMRIGNFLSNKTHDFLYEVLSASFVPDGYAEIEMINSDIKQCLTLPRHS